METPSTHRLVLGIDAPAQGAAAAAPSAPSEAAGAILRVPCTLCGSANRVPIERFEQSARCGHCSSPLMTGAIAAVRAARLERMLTSCDLPVIVQVAGERVPPERRRDAQLRQMARDLRGSALVLRVDPARDPGALDALGLSAEPSLALVLGGRVVSGLSGALDRDALGEWLAARAADALHG